MHAEQAPERQRARAAKRQSGPALSTGAAGREGGQSLKHAEHLGRLSARQVAGERRAPRRLSFSVRSVDAIDHRRTPGEVLERQGTDVEKATREGSERAGKHAATYQSINQSSNRAIEQSDNRLM